MVRRGDLFVIQASRASGAANIDTVRRGEQITPSLSVLFKLVLVPTAPITLDLDRGY